jgi:type II secretory pathway predicted ATPase ExeA
MDYEEFFKLSQRPFKPTLEAKFFYQAKVFERLVKLLGCPDLPRLVLLVGLEGSGKSTLIKRLPKAISEASRMAPVLDQTANFADILRHALTFLGLGFKCPPSARDEELLGFFQNAVDDTAAKGLGFVLAIDDADRLDPETLNDLLTLSRLEDVWEGRFCLALASRPFDSDTGDGHDDVSLASRPFDSDTGNGQKAATLASLESLAQEALVIEAKPLSLAETTEYISLRLAAAGATKEFFTIEALSAIQSYSQGLPRNINSLAEKSLMAAWASRKAIVNNHHVFQAKANLDKPETVNERAAKVAAGAERARHKISGRSWISLLSAAVIIGLMTWLLWPSAVGQSTISIEANPLPDLQPIVQGPETTPSADPSPEGALGLPSIPPSIVKLPQGAVALVVENGQQMARLWQGGIRGPGLKAEISAPDFKEPGLYLVGRPKSPSPIIFRYPPEPDIPRAASERLWRRVETLLPQDILPLMVGPSLSLAQSVPPAIGAGLSDFLHKWSAAQKNKKPQDMANLYAETFAFFEPGHKPVAISRRNFRQTLESEALVSGEISLTTSDPLIMLDPRDQNRAWIVFTLKYDSKSRHNIGLRTLILEKKRSKEWSIVAELWLKDDLAKS